MMSNDQTIVVSGCTKGIGRAVCELFAREGFHVAGYARNKENIAHMQASFSQRFPGQQFLFLPADATIKKDISDFARQIKQTFRSIDILVNNAGIFLPGLLMQEEEGRLEQLIETNLYSAYYLTREIIPNMMAQQRGHVINMCSVASIKSYQNGGSYGISKFALLGFSKQLREEMKPHNIKVTAMIPGATYTDSWAGADIPESRFMQPEDVAKTILSICQLSEYADVEEVIIRPQLGDI